MARVLITGATGFVGSHAIQPLLSGGYDVHAITSQPSRADNEADSVSWHTTDLFDEAATRALLSKIKPTHLLHLAWYVEPGKLISAHENFDWVASSMNLVRAFREAGGERVVCCGSCYEYSWRDGVCGESTTPTTPDTIYGVTKNALREMIEAYAQNTDLSVAWARAFFLYGPRENPNRLASSIVLSLLKNQPAKCSHGRQVRDYGHVQDIADGIVALLDSDYQGALNVATGAETQVRDIATAIGDILGKPELIELGALPARPNDVPVVIADISKSREVLDWKPKFDLKSGLQHTIEWWRRNPDWSRA